MYKSNRSGDKRLSMPFSTRYRNSDILLLYFRSKIIIISNIITNKTATRVTFANPRKLFSGLVVSPLCKWVYCISRKSNYVQTTVLNLLQIIRKIPVAFAVFANEKYFFNSSLYVKNLSM